MLLRVMGGDFALYEAVSSREWYVLMGPSIIWGTRKEKETGPTGIQSLRHEGSESVSRLVTENLEKRKTELKKKEQTTMQTNKERE